MKLTHKELSDNFDIIKYFDIHKHSYEYTYHVKTVSRKGVLTDVLVLDFSYFDSKIKLQYCKDIDFSFMWKNAPFNGGSHQEWNGCERINYGEWKRTRLQLENTK